MSRSSMKIATVRPCTPVHIYMYMYTVKHIVHVHLQYNYGGNGKNGHGTRLQQLPSPGVKLALRVNVETFVAILAVGEHPEITQHVLIHL